MRAVLITEPMREINNNAGEETGFGGSQQQAHRVELPARVHEPHANSHQAPGNQDACDPFSGAPAFHNNRAGNLQQKIAHEENSRSEAEYTVAETEVARHLQTGESYVH